MSFYSEFLSFTFLSLLPVGLFYLLEDNFTRPWMRWLWWIASSVFVVLVGWQAGTEHAWADFGNGYYFGGRKILQNPGDLYPGENCGGYVNFPLLAFAFVPFGTMPKDEAGRIYFLIGALSILAIAHWLVKFGNLKGIRRWWILFLLLISGPLDYSIWLGNTTHLVMLLMLMALWWFRQGKGWVTGGILGVVGLVKIPLIIPSGYFLVRRQWQVLGGAMLAAGMVALASFVLIPPSLNLLWFRNCILAFSGHPVAAYNNQSVIGVLARGLIAGSDVYYWLPIEPNSLFGDVSRWVALVFYMPAIMVVISGWKSSRTKSLHLLEFFIVLTCSLLTSPISWTHYFILLLVPVVVYINDDNILRMSWLNVLLLASLLLVTVPVNFSLMLYDQLGSRIYLSLNFIGGTLFYIFLIILWWLRRNAPNQVSRIKS